MGDSRPHHLPLDPPIPPLTLSSPTLLTACTQMMWWDEVITMDLPTPQTRACHELGPPFHTALDSSGSNLHVLAYTGDTTVPDPECADAIVHALADLINQTVATTASLSHERETQELAPQVGISTLKSITIPLASSFVRSSVHPDLLVALPSLGFMKAKPTTISALGTRDYQKKSLTRKPSLPPSVRLSEVTTPEDLATKIAIESILFKYSPSQTYRLRLALEYMTYGTAQARDHHYLAWFTDPHTINLGREGEEEKEIPIAYMTLRVGRGVAYLQGAGVLEPWRRQGITRAMLDHVIDVAVQLGFEVMCNTAWTDDAAAAWRAMGFEDVGEFTQWRWTRKSSTRTDQLT